MADALHPPHSHLSIRLVVLNVCPQAATGLVQLSPGEQTSNTWEQVITSVMRFRCSEWRDTWRRRSHGGGTLTKNNEREDPCALNAVREAVPQWGVVGEIQMTGQSRFCCCCYCARGVTAHCDQLVEGLQVLEPADMARHGVSIKSRISANTERQKGRPRAQITFTITMWADEGGSMRWVVAEEPYGLTSNRRSPKQMGIYRSRRARQTADKMRPFKTDRLAIRDEFSNLHRSTDPTDACSRIDHIWP